MWNQRLSLGEKEEKRRRWHAIINRIGLKIEQREREREKKHVNM